MRNSCCCAPRISPIRKSPLLSLCIRTMSEASSAALRKRSGRSLSNDMETNHDDRWVAGQLALLDPEWRPDLAHGRSLLEEGLKKPARSSSWMVVAAAAAVCIAAVALPQTRAFAQQLW